MSELQPVGWQYRFKHGDWTSWINIPVNLDDFTRIQKDSLKKGAVELRPIYSGDQVEQLRNQLVNERSAAIEECAKVADDLAVWFGTHQAFLAEDAVDDCARKIRALTDDHQSSLEPDTSGEDAIKQAANEAAPGAQIIRRDGDFHVYYAGFNLSKFVRFLALTSAQRGEK